MPENNVRAITGFNWEEMIELRGMLLSMSNSRVRDITQAIVVFFFKLLSGNSNATIAASARTVFIRVFWT